MSAFADGNCSQSACASFSRGCTEGVRTGCTSKVCTPQRDFMCLMRCCSDMGAGSRQRTQQRYRRPILLLVPNRLESIVEEAAVDSSVRDYLASGSTLGEGWEGTSSPTPDRPRRCRVLAGADVACAGVSAPVDDVDRLAGGAFDAAGVGDLNRGGDADPLLDAIFISHLSGYAFTLLSLAEGPGVAG